MRLPIVVLLAVFAAPPVGADSPLTLDRALALAEEHSPRLRAAAAITAGARAGVVTAQQYPNPDVELFTGRMSVRLAGNLPGSVNSVGIAQPLDLPRIREPREQAARAGLAAAEAGDAEARLALRADVSQAFFDTLRRQAELTLAEDTVALLEQVRKRVEIRVNVGEAARFELLRADAETLAAASAAESARLRVQQARAQLRSIIGAPLPADFVIQGELLPRPLLPPVGDLRAKVLASHPALAQGRAAVEQARRRVDTERAQRTPVPTLRAGIDQDPEFRTLRFGVSLPLPVWNRRDGQIAEAISMLTLAEQALELRRIELEAALESSYARYNGARRQITTLERVVTQAEAALRVAEAAYRFGERGILEVIDAQRTLRAVRQDFLNTRYELQSAWIDLERLRATDGMSPP